MKILIIGGAHQGKTAYARAKFPEDLIIFTALHEKVREELARGADISAAMLGELQSREDWVVVCNEVGCGPVPADAPGREYREAVGRLCCEIAKLADAVVRVVCGIPTAIKGELP